MNSFLKWVVVNWPKLSSKQLFTFNKQTYGFQRHVEEEEKMFANSIEASKISVMLIMLFCRFRELSGRNKTIFYIESYLGKITSI